MTVQEKAQEIIDYHTLSFFLNNEFGEFTFSQIKPSIKHSAIITINQIIKVAPWGGDEDVQTEDGSKEFYINVKTQIEKL